MKREYAVYKDDEFICMGTLQYIADFLGVKYHTVLSYKSRKIYIFVRVK